MPNGRQPCWPHRQGSRSKPMKRHRSLALALVAAVLASLPAAAQEWPTKSVRIIVPFAAGGAADTAARLYSEALSQTFGKQFVIENRPGGGGIPVAEAVSRAEPDGYTLMVSGVPVIVVGPAMNKNVSYDPMRDLTHIAYFGGTPNMLAVHRSLGIKTYAEFLAYARKQPTGTDYVSAGFGTMGNWNAEYLATLEKVRLNHIAYKGGSQAIVDLVAGHVKASVLTWTAIAQHVRSGTLDALAVTSAKRLPYLPDVPFRELGHKDFVSVTWFSLSGPPKLPRDVVDKINAVVVKAMNRPEIRKTIQRDAIETAPMTPAELNAFAQAEIDRWGPLVRRIMARRQK
ncbi:MAG: tripartite tricarboxylate transporter substrate binding protein [Rhizobiales bacterium]|nr:tripartite tricarboxylate transporter substrate binding protein [Hyphomicrobiales bacterium]